MTTPSDQLLAQRAGEGDLSSFEQLVRRHQLPIIRLCVNLLGDEHAAQDTAQDTFLTAWRSIGRFRGHAELSTWLYRIATNRCLKELKKRPPTADVTPMDLPATEGLPHESVEASERFATIAAAIGRLPENQRVPLLLREVEDLTYNEIAEILGVTMTAVKAEFTGPEWT